MNIISRPQRFVWVLGILLLVGTAAGAGWFFHHDEDPATSKTPPAADFIIANGYGDMAQGIAALYPLQPGRVAAVYVKENDAVSEGDLLLSTDNSLSRYKLEEAAAGLKAARLTLEDAELAVQVHQLKIEQQQEKIKAVEAALKIQQENLAIKERLYNNNENGKPGRPLISKEELTISQQLVKVEAAKLAGEKLILQAAQKMNPTNTVNQAKEGIKAKEARFEQARLGLLEHDVYAPADGTILRLFTSKGELLGSQPKLPALQFCPNGERIIRAEVQQEWAAKIAVGQVAVVEDEARAGFTWHGKVKRISDWFTQRRSMLQEPFQYNDVRTLECIIAVEPGSRPLRIGQRVRVTIKQGGP